MLAGEFPFSFGFYWDKILQRSAEIKEPKTRPARGITTIYLIRPHHDANYEMACKISTIFPSQAGWGGEMETKGYAAWRSI